MMQFTVLSAMPDVDGNKMDAADIVTLVGLIYHARCLPAFLSGAVTNQMAIQRPVYDVTMTSVCLALS